jgi:hypothetical protein
VTRPSAGRTAAERSLAARVAANARWARLSSQDRQAATARARSARMDRWEREVDPDGLLEPAERARRAANAMKAHMGRMGLAASKKRTSGGAA